MLLIAAVAFDTTLIKAIFSNFCHLLFLWAEKCQQPKYSSPDNLHSKYKTLTLSGSAKVHETPGGHKTTHNHI